MIWYWFYNKPFAPSIGCHWNYKEFNRKPCISILLS